MGRVENGRDTCTSENRSSPLQTSMTARGVVPLRHLRHVPPDSIAIVVNSLQNRVNSITLCITVNAKTGKID